MQNIVVQFHIRMKSPMMLWLPAPCKSLTYWTGVSLNQGKRSQNNNMCTYYYSKRRVLGLYYCTAILADRFRWPAPGTSQRSALLDSIGRNCQNNMGESLEQLLWPICDVKLGLCSLVLMISDTVQQWRWSSVYMTEGMGLKKNGTFH